MNDSGDGVVQFKREEPPARLNKAIWCNIIGLLGLKHDETLIECDFRWRDGKTLQRIKGRPHACSFLLQDTIHVVASRSSHFFDRLRERQLNGQHHVASLSGWHFAERNDGNIQISHICYV